MVWRYILGARTCQAVSHVEKWQMLPTLSVSRLVTRPHSSMADTHKAVSPLENSPISDVWSLSPLDCG